MIQWFDIDSSAIAVGHLWSTRRLIWMSIVRIWTVLCIRCLALQNKFIQTQNWIRVIFLRIGRFCEVFVHTNPAMRKGWETCLGVGGVFWNVCCCCAFAIFYLLKSWIYTVCPSSLRKRSYNKCRENDDPLDAIVLLSRIEWGGREGQQNSIYAKSKFNPTHGWGKIQKKNIESTHFALLKLLNIEKKDALLPELNSNIDKNIEIARAIVNLIRNIVVWDSRSRYHKINMFCDSMCEKIICFLHKMSLLTWEIANEMNIDAACCDWWSDQFKTIDILDHAVVHMHRTLIWWSFAVFWEIVMQ